jgi:hypothetical protein
MLSTVLSVIIASGSLLAGEPAIPDDSPSGKALAELTLNPRDTYLQYVALQLARRDDNLKDISTQVEQLVFGNTWQRQSNRRNDVDLFNLMSGALALQESLQLESMLGAPSTRLSDRPIDEARVPIEGLKVPEIKSHPWEKMLAGRKPAISPLAMFVPEDCYFAEFKSLNNLLDIMETSDLWGVHLFNQAAQEAHTQNIGQRLKQQLVLETNPLMKPIYDLVVEEVAVTGSDLYIREGSDVTLIFKLKQPELFKLRVDGFVTNAEKSWPNSKRSQSKYLNVEYGNLSTPDREINVYWASPKPDIHIRSNSLMALQRTIEAMQTGDAGGNKIRRLGELDEFSYIRTLMPRGDKNEGGFVYLSDPFIRKLVGPRLKLTEKHRLICYNHLRMIGHASLLYRTENGKVPDSLAMNTLAKTPYAPGVFGKGELVCPDGGQYTLSPDGTFGICSHHGHAQYLVPCCEILVSSASKAEVQEYESFVEEYSRYWRTFFDPIALRIQATPQRYRMETLILPLIDNSIYTQMAASFGGTPAALDSAPVLKRSIFSVATHFNKEVILHDPNLNFSNRSVPLTCQ